MNAIFSLQSRTLVLGTKDSNALDCLSSTNALQGISKLCFTISPYSSKFYWIPKKCF